MFLVPKPFQLTFSRWYPSLFVIFTPSNHKNTPKTVTSYHLCLFRSALHAILKQINSSPPRKRISLQFQQQVRRQGEISHETTRTSSNKPRWTNEEKGESSPKSHRIANTRPEWLANVIINRFESGDFLPRPKGHSLMYTFECSLQINIETVASMFIYASAHRLTC